jgi:uncharacterized protein (DUF305 family)
MAFRTWSFSAAVLCAAAAMAQTQNAPAPIVQPGAPGQPTKTLSQSAVKSTRAPFDADVEFMQGMIMHHNQAVEMVDLLRTRGKSTYLKAFGEKIRLSQSDEMRFMKEWLIARGKATTMEMDHSKMDMSNMKMDDNGQMLMPGMLTPEQMVTLAKAKGAEFDHLFLTGMIQHHGGALTMVDELFSTPGAGQDPVLFDFAVDITNTQSAEIKLMQGLLDKEKK